MYSYLDKMQVGVDGVRGEQRRSDRAGPDAELGTDDLDPVHIRHMNATHELPPERVEQDVAGRGNPAADYDSIHTDQYDHVAGADPQVAPGIDQTLLGTRVAGSRRGDRLLNARLAASRGDRIGPGQRFQA